MIMAHNEATELQPTATPDNNGRATLLRNQRGAAKSDLSCITDSGNEGGG
jgi:hypothetical protein